MTELTATQLLDLYLQRYTHTHHDIHRDGRTIPQRRVLSAYNEYNSFNLPTQYPIEKMPQYAGKKTTPPVTVNQKLQVPATHLSSTSVHSVASDMNTVNISRHISPNSFSHDDSPKLRTSPYTRLSRDIQDRYIPPRIPSRDSDVTLPIRNLTPPDLAEDLFQQLMNSSLFFEPPPRHNLHNTPLDTTGFSESRAHSTVLAFAQNNSPLHQYLDSPLDGSTRSTRASSFPRFSEVTSTGQRSTTTRHDPLNSMQMYPQFFRDTGLYPDQVSILQSRQRGIHGNDSRPAHDDTRLGLRLGSLDGHPRHSYGADSWNLQSSYPIEQRERAHVLVGHSDSAADLTRLVDELTGLGDDTPVSVGSRHNSFSPQHITSGPLNTKPSTCTNTTAAAVRNTNAILLREAGTPFVSGRGSPSSVLRKEGSVLRKEGSVDDAWADNRVLTREVAGVAEVPQDKGFHISSRSLSRARDGNQERDGRQQYLGICE